MHRAAAEYKERKQSQASAKGASAKVAFLGSVHGFLSSAGAKNLGYVFAYPNPFRESTVIVYELADQADVSAKIYTTAGRLIRRLHDDRGGQPGQNRTLVWDGRDETGDPVANGVYFLKLEAKDLEAGGAPLSATARLARIR